MSLNNKEKHTMLLSDKVTSDMKRTSHFMIVMIMFLQLILPVMVFADDSSTNDDAIEPTAVEVQSQEENSDADIESPGSKEDVQETSDNEIEEVNQPEKPIVPDSEEKEEAPDNIVEEPVNDPEDNTNQQPPPSEPEEQEAEKPEAGQGSDEEEKETVVDEEQENVVQEEPYDPGDMLDGFPARPYEGAPVLIQKFAPGSLGAASALQNKSGMMQTTNTHGLAPGEVRTTKTATRVQGMVNTWDITVRIEGRDDNKVEKTDVVLVIDRSGSMGDDNKMQNAKNAANNFINEMIGTDPNLRIGIVSFGENVTVNRQFTRNINQLHSSVNGLWSNGGTHTQAGILQGRELLNGSDIDTKKFIVLLSDGQPTFSYQPSNWTTTRPSWAPGSADYYGIYNGNYGTTTRGGGSSLIDRYTTGFIFTTSYYVNNGLAAIRAGQDSRVGINALFTIAVQAGTDGTPILEQIASPGLAYSTQDPDELEEIYDRIGTQIATQYALKFPSVVDEMGDGFTLIESTLDVTDGTTSVTPANASNNQTINWDISPTVTRLVDGSTDVRYAEMTYRVEINDDILDIQGAKTNEHQLFKTNKVTNLNYVDADDVERDVAIESPKVDPVLMKVKKILKDGYGNVINNDARRFNVNINKVSPLGYNHNENLVPGADYVWLTSLRHEGNYTVAETGITGPGETNLSNFGISYNINGTSTTNFVVNHINGSPRGDVTIQVTNQEIRKIDVTGTKNWVGGPIRKPDIQLQLLRNGQAHLSPVTLSSGTTTYTWVGLNEFDAQGNPYVYTVREVDPPPGYESSHSGTTVTNTFIIPQTGVAKATKVWEGSSSADFFEVDLTLWRTIDGTNFEVVNAVPDVTPNAAGTEYHYEWTNLATTDMSGNSYTFYFTEDTVPNGFERIYSNAITRNNVQYGKSGSKVTNRELTIDLSFMKVDELGNPLVGSTFRLEKHVTPGPNTIIINTGTDPTFTYLGLEAGRYTLTELSAPDGYIMPDDNTWVFDVVWDDDTKQMVIEFVTGDDLDLNDGDYVIANYPKGQLPDTGGPGNGQYILIGILALAGLGAVYVWRNKRDEVTQND